jgi:hypothetical protein
VTVLGHAEGPIDVWGFAYAGGVIGIVATALWLVHQAVARSTDPERAVDVVRRLPRWLVLVGFVCGVSIGLGTGRVLDHLFADPLDPAEVATRLCDAAAAPSGDFRAVHDDLDHLAADLDSADLARAHDLLDAAVANGASAAAVEAATAEVVRQLEPSASCAAAAP